MKTKILEALNIIRLSLQADGGDIELVDFNDKTGQVKVKLIGACSSCPMAAVTLKEGVERYLKSEVKEVKEVVAV